MLKCLASGKKSIEQLVPIDLQQTSVLELLLVCYFCILLCIIILQNVNYTMCAWTLSKPPDDHYLLVRAN